MCFFPKTFFLPRFAAPPFFKMSITNFALQRTIDLQSIPISDDSLDHTTVDDVLKMHAKHIEDRYSLAKDTGQRTWLDPVPYVRLNLESGITFSHRDLRPRN